MNRAYLLLGGNMGKVPETFRKARNLIEKKAGKICCESLLYRTEPWGMKSRIFFYNQALAIDTEYAAETLLWQLQHIENRFGRTREPGKVTSRKLDIDILFFNDEVIDIPQLQIPHPRMHLRRFALVPLNDIAPAKMHPVNNKTVGQLLKECEDPLDVFPLDDHEQFES